MSTALYTSVEGTCQPSALSHMPRGWLPRATPRKRGASLTEAAIEQARSVDAVPTNLAVGGTMKHLMGTGGQQRIGSSSPGSGHSPLKWTKLDQRPLDVWWINRGWSPQSCLFQFKLLRHLRLRR